MKNISVCKKGMKQAARLWQRHFQMAQGSVDSLCLVPGDPVRPVDRATAKKNARETCKHLLNLKQKVASFTSPPFGTVGRPEFCSPQAQPAVSCRG